MAGHSQFKNIMHRKGAQDAKRARIFAKIIREITVSVRGGSPEPTANPRLRAALHLGCLGDRLFGARAHHARSHAQLGEDRRRHRVRLGGDADQQVIACDLGVAVGSREVTCGRDRLLRARRPFAGVGAHRSPPSLLGGC